MRRLPLSVVLPLAIVNRRACIYCGTLLEVRQRCLYLLSLAGGVAGVVVAAFLRRLPWPVIFAVCALVLAAVFVLGAMIAHCVVNRSDNGEFVER